jgi:hypothetical protein
VIVIAATTFFLYPGFYGASLLIDTVWGEQQVLHHLLEHSQRFVWDTFWEDWLAALPFSLIFALPLVLAVLWLVKSRGWNPFLTAVSVLVAGALLCSILLFDGAYPGLVVLTAVFLSIPVGLLLRILRR